MEQRAIDLSHAMIKACPIPATARLLMEVTTNHEETDVEEVFRILKRDPIIGTEVLRIANSAAFGRLRKFTVVRGAALAIGIRELNRMAIAMGLIMAFRSHDEVGPILYSASGLSASIGRLAAAALRGADRSEAFLAGLLCEIGAMGLVQVDTNRYTHLWHETHEDWALRADREREIYGATSEEMGAVVLSLSGLSDDVCASVRCLPNAENPTPLQRTTLFARHVSHCVKTAPPSTQLMELLENNVPAFAKLAGLGLKDEELVELCFNAVRQ